MKILYETSAMYSSSRDRCMYASFFGKAIREELQNEGGELEILAYASADPTKNIAIKRNFFREKIRYVYTPCNERLDDREKEFRRKAESEAINDVLCSFDGDVVLLTSMFENYNGQDFVLPSDLSINGKFTAGIFYDAIPSIYPEKYLQDDTLKKWHNACIERAKTCHLLLAVSETARKDAIRYLHIPSDKVINVGTGINYKYKKIKNNNKSKIMHKYGIYKRFVMCNVELDWRKNIEGLIRSWGKMPQYIRLAIQLVIVCSITENQRNNFQEIARQEGIEDEIIFTGDILDDDLVILYNMTELIIFPSFYEGVCLPILEGMRCGAPIIGANNSYIKEVISKPDAMFNAYDIDDMSRTIKRGLTDRKFRQELIEWSQKRCLDFSWDISAKKAVEAIRDGLCRQSEVKIKWENNHGKFLQKKIAYILGNKREYLQDDIGVLSVLKREGYSVSVFLEETNKEDGYYKWDELVTLACEYDLLIYRPRGREADLYPFMISYPGIVIIDDFYIGESIKNCSNDLVDIKEEVFYSHGYTGFKELMKYGVDYVIYKLPMNKRMLDVSYGVVFTSKECEDLCLRFYGKKYLERINPTLITKTNELMPMLNSIDTQKETRIEYGIESDDFVIVSYSDNESDGYKEEKILKSFNILREKAEKTNLWLFMLGVTERRNVLRKLYSRLYVFEDTSKIIFPANGKYEWSKYIQIADLVIDTGKLQLFFEGDITTDAIVNYIEEKMKHESDKSLRKLDDDSDNKIKKVALLKKELEIAIQKKHHDKMNLFLERTTRALVEFDYDDIDCERIAKAYEKNNVNDDVNRIYVCMGEEEYEYLKQNEPVYLRENPLFEMILCYWNEEMNVYMMDVWDEDKGENVAYTIDFYYNDWIVIAADKLKKNISRLKSNITQIINICVIENDYIFDNSEEKKFVSEIAYIKRIDDFWNLYKGDMKA